MVESPVRGGECGADLVVAALGVRVAEGGSMLRPIGSRVLVAPDPIRKPSAIVETVEYAPPLETSGRIVGLGRRFACERCGGPRPTPLQVGDRVIFSASAGQDVTIAAERFVMLDERDVLAVVGGA